LTDQHPLIEKVRAAGVVGAGGAGFPTHAKLSATARYLIINGAECEPLLRVDQQLLEMFPQELARAIRAVKECVQAECSYLAVKEKHHQVVELWRHLPGGCDHLFSMEDFYPAGDEQTMVHEILGVTVPEAGIPLEVGAVVVNVETLINIVAALDGRPVTHKYVTVGGAVKNPITVRVPVGVSYGELIALAGGVTIRDVACYDGGPMTGKLIRSLDDPVVKTTKGVLAVPAYLPCVDMRSLDLHTAWRRVRAACDQCRMCTDLCPRYLLGHRLEPHRIMSQAGFNTFDEAIKDMSLLCCDCGICELYSCPVGIPPRTLIIHIKNEEIARGRRYGKRLPEYHVRLERPNRKVPLKRLIAKLGLTSYDTPAPFSSLAVTPSHLRLLMRQAIGAPAVPQVHVGQQVAAGEVIGEIPPGKLGARVHAPLAGVVRQVNAESVLIEVRGE
jgi:Na+-translocating ferredoxin:NAD+ oxidoreductase RnfC subunit